MFCNQCGKENKEGINFCVQCGAPLRVNQQTSVGSPQYNNVGLSRVMSETQSKAATGRKSLLVIIEIFVLLLISTVNIMKVQMRVSNVVIRDELQQANNITSNIFETDSYIYYSNDEGLYRMDKGSSSTTQISKRVFYLAAGTDKSVYGFDENGHCYEIDDSTADIELVNGIEWDVDENSVNNLPIISGRYYFNVYQNGTVYKKLMAEKYKDYSLVLRSGDNEDRLSGLKLYKGYLYMSLLESNENSGKFIRVSLKTGKEERLSDKAISTFSFTDDQIVCQDIPGNIFIMNLNGSNEQEYTEIDQYESNLITCANGYIYYDDYYDDELYKISLNGGEPELLGDDDLYELSEVEGGFAAISDDGLTLLDYDCNEIITMQS